MNLNRRIQGTENSLTGLAVLFCLAMVLVCPAMVWAQSSDAKAYATMAGAGWFHVHEQNAVVDQDVIQGPDQDWVGAGMIDPGVVTYSKFLGKKDQLASGWGGAAAGGTLIIGFDQDFMNGQGALDYENYSGATDVDLPEGIDFLILGFGFAYNQPFTKEMGTVNVYVASKAYNPVVSDADPDTGLVTVTGDETQWVKISGWEGWQDGQWDANPDFKFSYPGVYGQILWGDLEGCGLDRARYIKIELGDGGYYTVGTTKNTTGRALFIDSVKSLYHEPSAHAGNDRRVLLSSQAIVLDGTDSSDIDGDSLTFAWEQSSGTAVSLTDADSATPTFTVDRVGEYSFELTVSDGVFSMVDPVTITVVASGENQTPVADAGEDMLGNAGALVTLDGSNSYDPDGDSLSFSWTQISGTPVELANANTKKTSFTAQSVPVPLEFELTVTDPSGLTSTDSIVVTINRPPFIDLSRTEDTATENLLFTLNASSSWDPDLDELTYEWEQLSGPAVSLSNADSAKATFLVPEYPGEKLGFRVTVSDSKGLSVQGTVSATIRELYIIATDNPATSAWQVGSHSYRSGTLDLAKEVLGLPDMTSSGDGDASGFPDGSVGQITVKFNIPVADGDGDDLTVYHFGTGNVEIQASIDGDTWVSLGSLDSAGLTINSAQTPTVHTQNFDLADYTDLSESKVISVQYLKFLKEDTDGPHYVDGIVSHFTALTTIYAAFAEEADDMVDWVDKKIDNGEHALGEPDYDPSVTGVGNCSGWMVNSGQFVAGFDNPLADRDGPDLYIHHFGQGVTDSDITLGYTDGATTVEVSTDGSTWIMLDDLPLGENGGNTLNSDSFDFSDYPDLGQKDPHTGYRDVQIRYVRINKNFTGYTSGKFIDAIEARYAYPGFGNPAGADMVITEGTAVTLGRKNPSRDDYEDTVYTWEQVDNGSPAVTLSDSSIKNPTFVTPAVDSDMDFYFKLTRINESEFGTSVSFVTITVQDNGITGFPSDAITFYNEISGTAMALQAVNGSLIYFKASDPDYEYSAGYIEETSNRPKNLTYGMLDFTMVVTPGEQAVLRVLLDEAAPDESRWFKYTEADGWATCTKGNYSQEPDDGAVFQTGRKRVLLRITDNGPLDDDDEEGVVRDPSGLGIPGGWHGDVSDVGGGGGGCFIGTLLGRF